MHDLLKAHFKEISRLNLLDLLLDLKVSIENVRPRANLGYCRAFNTLMLTLGFHPRQALESHITRNFLLIVEPCLDSSAPAVAIRTLGITMERLELVNLGLIELLKVKVLESEILVRLGLLMLVIFTPCDLQHSLEGPNSFHILLVLLVHPPNLLVNQNRLLIVICFLN